MDDATFVQVAFQDFNHHALLSMITQICPDDMVTLITKQMTAQKGLKLFGEKEEKAIMTELEQLLYQKVMEGQKADKLTREQSKQL